MALRLGTWNDEAVRWASVVQDTRTYLHRLHTKPREHLTVLFLLTLGLMTALTDGVSTYVAVSSGLYEEANGVAAGGMGVVGLELYIVFATLVSLALSSLLLLRGPGLFGRAIPAFALCFIGFKCLVVVGNFVQWDGFWPGF